VLRVDVSGLTFIDSAASTTSSGPTQQLRADSRQLVLVRPGPAVARSCSSPGWTISRPGSGPSSERHVAQPAAFSAVPLG
jgi:hypothetical protein